MQNLLTVLIVEDERFVQDMVKEALAGGGFESSVASSGEDAVALLRDNHGKYQALVTDINLSGDLNGWDVAQCARELDPDMPVIYMSGAAGDEWASRGVPHSILLNKPFAPAQVVTAVAQLLNAGGSPTPSA
jgi:DNA-binding response OmpR family regulator